MSAKRIRCSCGRVYDPVKRPACPDCGAPSPVATAPEPPPNEQRTPTAAPVEKKGVPPPVAPSPSGIPQRYLIIGVVMLCVLGLLVYLGRSPGPKKTEVVKTAETTPQPSATPTLTPGASVSATATAIPSATAVTRATPIPSATPKPTATAIVQREVSTPTPAPTLAPPPSPPPKVQGEEFDLAGAIANAEPNATIKVRPGNYASLNLERPIHLVGDSNGPVFIKSEAQTAISVKTAGVVLDNIQVLTHAIGNLPAIRVADGVELEMNSSTIQSSSEIGILASAKASLKGRGLKFALPNGTALRLTNGATADLTQCSFADTKTGLAAGGGASAQFHSCAFERVGGNDGHGSVIALNGQGTSVTADDCQFSANRAGLLVAQQAKITITNSTFQANEAGPADGIVGLLVARQGGSASLTSDHFRSNHSGVLATAGGRLELENCDFDQNGTRQSGSVVAGALPLSVAGQGSSAVVRHCVLTRSVPYAASVFAGGELKLEESEISGAGQVGLLVGDRSAPGGHAAIKASHFLGNTTGLGICATGSATAEETEFRENTDGIIALDSGSELRLTKCQLVKNRRRGLHVLDQATGQAVDCDLKDNVQGALSGVLGKSNQRASVTLENCRFSANHVFGVGAGRESELVLDGCAFDGTDKKNIYQDRGAKVTVNGPADESPTPTASPEKDWSNDNKRRRRPTPRPHPPTPEDIKRTLRKFLPGGQ